jgi:hypothetical protein
MSASHGPYVVRGSMVVVGNKAVVEVHAPRARRAIRTRRPVPGRLYARKRIPFFPPTSSSRIGKRWIAISLVHHRHPLLLGR